MSPEDRPPGPQGEGSECWLVPCSTDSLPGMKTGGSDSGQEASPQGAQSPGKRTDCPDQMKGAPPILLKWWRTFSQKYHHQKAEEGHPSSMAQTLPRDYWPEGAELQAGQAPSAFSLYSHKDKKGPSGIPAAPRSETSSCQTAIPDFSHGARRPMLTLWPEGGGLGPTSASAAQGQDFPRILGEGLAGKTLLGEQPWHPSHSDSNSSVISQQPTQVTIQNTLASHSSLQLPMSPAEG